MKNKGQNLNPQSNNQAQEMQNTQPQERVLNQANQYEQKPIANEKDQNSQIQSECQKSDLLEANSNPIEQGAITQDKQAQSVEQGVQQSTEVQEQSESQEQNEQQAQAESQEQNEQQTQAESQEQEVQAQNDGDKKQKHIKGADELKGFRIVSVAITVGIAILSAILTALLFINPAIKSRTSYDSKLGVYKNSQFDFIVYDPIQEQVEEINSLNYVNKVLDYYMYGADITNGNSSYQTKAIFSDKLDAIDITQYNENTLREGSTNIKEGEIFLDYIAAKNINAKVGDKISLSMQKVSNLQFTVVGIFETNTMYDEGAVFFPYVGATKDTINATKSIYLKGIMIDANNLSACYQHLLDTYIPYGRMEPREKYDSDMEYENYVKNFEKENYKHDVYNKSIVIESLETSLSHELKNISSKILVGSIVCALVMLLMALVPVYALYYEKQFEKRTRTIIEKYKYRVQTNLDNVVGYTLCFAWIIIMYSIMARIADMNLAVLLLPICKVAGIALLCSFVVITVASNLILKRVNNG